MIKGFTNLARNLQKLRKNPAVEQSCFLAVLYSISEEWTMKNVVRATSAAILLSSSMAASSAVDLSGNVTLTSDYKFRGISQSDGVAIQGSFDLGTELGFYAAVWGSSLNYGGGLELDYILGYATDLTDNIGIDVGYIYYDYPGWDTKPDADGDPKGNFQEFYGVLTLWGAALSAAYSDDYFAETGSAWYYTAGYDLSFTDTLGLSLHAGHSSFDDAGFFETLKDYTDWKIALIATVSGFDLELAYVDTDVDESDCWDSNLCKASAVLSVSRSM